MLVGLTALLIGGLGVAGAVRAWLASRMPVIATLKCLGAPANLIFRVYLLQVMLISSLGVCLGVVLATIAPALALDILGAYITVPLTLSVYPIPLAIAAGFGLVTSFLFALWPLAKAEEVRAAHLFRSLVEMPQGRPRTVYLMMTGAALAALALLAFLATRSLALTVSFVGGCIGALFLTGLGEILDTVDKEGAITALCAGAAGAVSSDPSRITSARCDHRLWTWALGAGCRGALPGQFESPD